MNHQQQKGSVLFLLMLAASALLAAQNFPNLQFSHLTTKDGLSSNYTTAVAEDPQGFIWIGTGNGLNRYDGYRIKHYYHNNTDSNSLVSNNIQKIYCDTKGRLWICTEDGVSCFVPSSNRFINYTALLPPPHHLKNNSSVTVYEDDAHTIWLCNQQDVLYKINDQLQAEEWKINLPAFSFFQQQKMGYDHIIQDRQGNEWAFKSNRIYAIDRQTKQVAKTFILPALSKSIVLKMIQDEQGKYFLSTWNGGVFSFDPQTNTSVQIKVLPTQIFTDITEWTYKKQTWLIGLDANLGLYLYDNTSQSSFHYQYVAGDPGSIQGSSFVQTFIDSKQHVWIASNSGLNIITAAQNAFDILPVTEPGSTNYSLYKNGTVFSYSEDDSSIWLAKRYVSTFEYDNNFGLKNSYAALFPLSTVNHNSNGAAYYFYKYDNEIFITTDSGLIVYNKGQKTSSIFFPGTTPSATDLRTIVPISTDELLIRSVNDGLYVFSRTQKKFTRHYDNQTICSSCNSLKLTYLFKARDNSIYVCSLEQHTSFFIYQPQVDRFTAVNPGNDKNLSLHKGNLFGIDEDKAGNLWITGSAGLFVYNPTTNQIIKRIPPNNGVGTFFRICFDDAGNAWVNGVAGIGCYVTARDKWINFNGEDGLPGNQFEGIMAKRPNGDIVAGLEGAIAVFHPAQLFSSNGEPATIITEAAIGDSTVYFPLLQKASKTLELKPGTNSFAVDFAVLNYVNPVASSYYYQLLPVMENFQQSIDGHINFNGLAPGSYTLHVKGGNKAGIIFSSEDVLTINILPHWYQTLSFKIAALLVAALVLALFVKRRISAAKKRAELKQKIAETEMQALRAQMNPHFIFNSLNSIENFMMQNEKRLASDYLNKFSRLIRSILDSSRNEWVPIEKDMEALQLYVDLQLLRLNNKFVFETDIEPALLDGDNRVPALLIQPFVENAIEHGLAHSERDNLVLKVTAVAEDEYIIYTIEDNGIGRALAASYNSKNKPQHKSVGLQITNTRISMINSQPNNIEITDLYDAKGEPIGTRVTIKIKTI